MNKKTITVHRTETGITNAKDLNAAVMSYPVGAIIQVEIREAGINDVNTARADEIVSWYQTLQPDFRGIVELQDALRELSAIYYHLCTVTGRAKQAAGAAEFQRKAAFVRHKIEARERGDSDAAATTAAEGRILSEREAEHAAQSEYDICRLQLDGIESVTAAIMQHISNLKKERQQGENQA